MNPDKEINLLTKYLTGLAATPEVENLYANAILKKGIPFSQKQAATWSFCLRHPGLLSFVDAGLAFGDPYHPIRNRIYIMMAILETQPAYNLFFLPQKRSPFYFLQILFSLAKAAFKILVGKMILWFL